MDTLERKLVKEEDSTECSNAPTKWDKNEAKRI